MGSDHQPCPSYLTMAISIHAPTWGATVGQYITSYAPRNFNPRSHVGSDSAAHPRSHCNKAFQSTLPRGERHRKFMQVYDRLEISIHAPTWGATESVDYINVNTTISIHAPTWGATDKTPGKPPWSYISIHAPTWGATHLPRWILSPWTISIHAPTWGATRQHIPGVTATRYFNPRSHVGSDIFYMHGTCHKGDFNPRSHVGSDLDSILHHTRLEISIHAPTWGATQAAQLRTLIKDISIHAPTWGATNPWSWAKQGKLISIHAPTWGATLQTVCLWH